MISWVVTVSYIALTLMGIVVECIISERITLIMFRVPMREILETRMLLGKRLINKITELIYICLKIV